MIRRHKTVEILGKMWYNKIIKTLKPHKSQNEVEKESEKLNEVFIRKGTDIDKIIEEFCRKYDI